MIRLGFPFRLKTGFYETKQFDFLISKGKLVLVPPESAESWITIEEQDILTITLKNEKALELDIQTRDNIYQGIFGNQTDFEELLGQLKENIHKRIVCEYEGRN